MRVSGKLRMRIRHDSVAKSKEGRMEQQRSDIREPS